MRWKWNKHYTFLLQVETYLPLGINLTMYQFQLYGVHRYMSQVPVTPTQFPGAIPQVGHPPAWVGPNSLPLTQRQKNNYTELSSGVLGLANTLTAFHQNENATTAQDVFIKCTHIFHVIRDACPTLLARQNSAGKVLMSLVWDSWQEDRGVLSCFDSPSIHFSPLSVVLSCSF